MPCVADIPVLSWALRPLRLSRRLSAIEASLSMPTGSLQTATLAVLFLLGARLVFFTYNRLLGLGPQGAANLTGGSAEDDSPTQPKLSSPRGGDGDADAADLFDNFGNFESESLPVIRSIIRRSTRGKLSPEQLRRQAVQSSIDRKADTRAHREEPEYLHVHPSETRDLSTFPCPFPNGWFKLLDSALVPPSTEKIIRCLGTEMVQGSMLPIFCFSFFEFFFVVSSVSSANPPCLPLTHTCALFLASSRHC